MITLNDCIVLDWQNDSNSTIDAYEETSPAYPASLLCLFLISGVIGNILVCLAVIREKKLHNVTNYFLMSLAVADLLVSILVMPIAIVTVIKGKKQRKLRMQINVVLS